MINKLATEIHEINNKNGFYEEEKNIGEMLALIHSEVSEALEADRVYKFSNKTLVLEEHIKDKMRYNSLREYKHGKKY